MACVRHPGREILLEENTHGSLVVCKGKKSLVVLECSKFCIDSSQLSTYRLTGDVSVHTLDLHG